MKIYLVCTLDSGHYREPYFYFFKTAFAAHKWVIDNLVSITEESREEVISELEYKNAVSYTHLYLWTEEEFKCGGHDLLKILEGNMGKYIHIEIELYSRC